MPLHIVSADPRWFVWAWWGMAALHSDTANSRSAASGAMVMAVTALLWWRQRGVRCTMDRCLTPPRRRSGSDGTRTRVPCDPPFGMEVVVTEAERGGSQTAQPGSVGCLIDMRSRRAVGAAAGSLGAIGPPVACVGGPSHGHQDGDVIARDPHRGGRGQPASFCRSLRRHSAPSRGSGASSWSKTDPASHHVPRACSIVPIR